MATNLQALHLSLMKKLNNLFPMKVRITYKDNSKVIINSRLSDSDIEAIKYDHFKGEDIKVFDIFISDLIESKASISGFKYLEYDGTKYEVLSTDKNGLFNNTLSLFCRIYKGNMNG